MPLHDLMNAICFNNGAMNVTCVVGPAAAGFVIVGVGIAGAFFAKAAIFVLALVFMALGSFGAMFAGVLTDLTNVAVALAIMGSICAVLAAVTYVAAPSVRRL